MPYKKIYKPKEVFLDYDGITIYHCYKDNNFDQKLEGWYSLVEEDFAGDKGEFAIGELSTYEPYKEPEDVIKQAIDMGELTERGVDR